MDRDLPLEMAHVVRFRSYIYALVAVITTFRWMYCRLHAVLI